MTSSLEYGILTLSRGTGKALQEKAKSSRKAVLIPETELQLKGWPFGLKGSKGVVVKTTRSSES